MNIKNSCSIIWHNLSPLSKLTSNTFFRNYAFKSDLKIKWVRPEKIPCYKPAKTGDLEPMPTIDRTQYQLEFKDCKELQTADETIKKLFSLEFAPRWKTTQVYIKDTVDLVRRHPLDKGSYEARIARWTGAVRALQDVMENFPKHTRVKVTLKELIDKRRKFLRLLRQWDYKRFEWLIDNLNLVYKPLPDDLANPTRKGSLTKLTQKYCDDIRNERLTAYRLKLEAEQPAFLEEKIRTLEFIRQEQKECNVEVTVTQEEIDKTKRQLESLRKENEETNS